MPRLLQISLLGHPVLRKKAESVSEIESSAFQELIDDMIATMIANKGVGLAAPQVYVSSRLFTIQSRPSERYPDVQEIPPTAVINPVVLSVSNETNIDWEGCFSMPGYQGLVTRPSQIRAAWTDRNGKRVEMELVSRAARVFLHELDHLDGVMFLERMESPHDLISQKMLGNSDVDEKLNLIRENSTQTMKQT